MVALVLLAALTVFGLVRFWPSGDSAQSAVGSTPFAVPGVQLPIATVVTVLPPCPPPTPDATLDAGPDGASDGAAPGIVATCGAITVRLDSTADGAEPQTQTPAGDVLVPVPGSVTDSGVSAGDQVQLIEVPASSRAPTSYSFLQVQSGSPLLLLSLFVLVVALVARWLGVRALLGLVVGGFVVVKFMLPALLERRSGVEVALAGSAAVMFVVLYLTHGLTIRTSTALAATLFGVGITSVLGLLAIDAARLSGVASDEGPP